MLVIKFSTKIKWITKCDDKGILAKEKEDKITGASVWRGKLAKRTASEQSQRGMEVRATNKSPSSPNP